MRSSARPRPRPAPGEAAPTATPCAATAPAIQRNQLTRSRLAVRLEEVIPVRARDGQPPRHEQRDHDAQAEDRRCREHDPARAVPAEQQPRRRHPEPDDDVVRAHDRGERTSTEPVRRTPLHEDLVADDGRAVPRGASDREGHRDPDRRAQSSPAPADRHQRDRARVVAAQAHLAERRCGEEAPDHESRSARADHHAEADVPGSKDVLDEEHLGDVDRCAPHENSAPDDEYRAQRQRPEHEPDAVCNVAPMPARQGLLRTQLRLADSRDEHRGDEERHRVDRVRHRGAPQADQDATDDRPDHPRRVLDRLQERVGVRELVVRHEIRQARVRSGTEEARRDPRDGGEPDDPERAVHERQSREYRDAAQV